MDDQRPASRAARGHGLHACTPGCEGKAADQRLHRRDRLARRGGRAHLQLYGDQGDFERGASLPRREGAPGEPPLGRRTRAETRADHLEHRAARPARLLLGGGEGAAADLPRMGGEAGAVGRADREARRGSTDAGADDGGYLRDGRHSRARGGDVRAGHPRHPARGGHGQALAQREALGHGGRRRADPRRAGLRDRRLVAARGARTPRPWSGACGTRAST